VGTLAKKIILKCYDPSLTRLPHQRAITDPVAGNTKAGSITVPLTSCLTGLD